MSKKRLGGHTNKALTYIAEEAAKWCDQNYRSVPEFQDCAQGVNTFIRIVKKSSKTERGLTQSARAALRLCALHNPHPGPVMRCKKGVMIARDAARE